MPQREPVYDRFCKRQSLSVTGPAPDRPHNPGAGPMWLGARAVATGRSRGAEASRGLPTRRVD